VHNTQVTGLDSLFDDAGLFPPASRPMAEALAAHRRALAGPHARLVGPFLCPVNRLAELDVCVASGVPRPPRLGVIAYDATIPWRHVAARPGVVQVEAPLGTDLARVGGRVRRYLELPHHGDVATSLDAVLQAGARAKVRCGGLTRDAVPSVAWLAAVLVGCAQRGIALKATAGLHEPFYRSGPEGIHHGFVNLLAAAAAARAGDPASAVAALLTAEDDQNGDLARRASRGRGLLVSIGTCSIDDPVRALTELGRL
jgi:hypothetical protein